MPPATQQRVAEHTAEHVNRRIERATERRIWYYTQHPDEIDQRLGEIEREWDIERALEANAAIAGFLGVVLATTKSRAWLALPALVTGFLFQHATQGWCPPLPALRRLGFRTSREIEIERNALKALRGDFAEPGASGNGGRPGERAASAAKA
jgi:hypothetical protein